MMGKKYIMTSIIVSLFAALIIGVMMPKSKEYKQENISVYIDTRVDTDCELKLYYAGDGEDYSEDKSITKKILRSDDFQKVEYIIPQNVSVLRIDYEGTGSFWDIKSISVNSKESYDLSSEMIDEFDKNDIPAASVSEEYITLKLGTLDPFLVYHKSLQGNIDKSINYRYIVMALTFVFLLIIFLRNYAIVVEMVKGIFNSRKQIKALAVSDFKSRFSGAYLGVVWGVIQPLMTILLFWFVFQVGFRSSPISNAPFILWLVAGMIPWNFFNDAWMNGNGSFVSYHYIVKKLVFNIDILPLVKILGSFILNIIFNLIMLVIYTLYGWFPGVHILDMIYFSLCLTLLAWGLSMITATLNVFMKDVGQFLTVLMQMLMWMTPIMWDYHMLTGKLVWIYRLNPLFYIVNGYRTALIEGKWFFYDYYGMLWFWLVTICVNVVGIKLMIKLKPHFADVL